MKKKHAAIGDTKGLNPCEQHVLQRTGNMESSLYITVSVAPEVAREPTVQLWALMSGAVWAIRLHFARHPATSPVLFHEKTTNATENCERITDLVRTTIRSRRFDVGGE